MQIDFNQQPHHRLNLLTGEWVLVSPQRTQRPWRGQVEKALPQERLDYDPDCYLCPGNQRAGGACNPDYQTTFVFTNDYAALQPGEFLPERGGDDLLTAVPVSGTCRVICFSPRHDLTLPEMDLATIREVIDLWAEQTAELGQTYAWVQVFENKGAMMGSSNPHPHGQIWAMDQLPNQAEREDQRQREYLARNGRSLLLDYLERELKVNQRLVLENRDWVALVPFWAVWPFETMLLPRRGVRELPELTESERESLAGILKDLLCKYDNLFETSFPYSMGWHGAPYLLGGQSHWQLHAHFYPPLLRSATVKKFMVGFEMLAEAQRDLTAEDAAARLRELPTIHYRENK
ncbi:MAG: UDP-glucose--hexose-1-phosphate uridylyltransferase [Anaerolineales bacterium]|jgi:UDPglucose--hexose-1-phosphate uridylyltransferase